MCIKLLGPHSRGGYSHSQKTQSRIRPRVNHWAVSVLLIVAFSLTACGGGGGGNSGNNGGIDNDGGINETFPPQTFYEDFDSGTAGARWGCGTSCGFDVVNAGPINTISDIAAKAINNFVFQSPDPMLLEGNGGLTCESFSARFEQEGTFAFDYFVKTAGPLGFQDGNRLEVSITTNIVEFDPDFNDFFPIDSMEEVVLEVMGEKSSRFQRILQPGFYDFGFCYWRSRTVDLIGPDFVQIDNVETCIGTGCMGNVPTVARCEADQGEILVPDTSTLPTDTFSITRVQGEPSRYYLIIDTQFLEFISGGLAVAGPQYDSFRAEIDGVRTVTLRDGKTCDLDQRTSLLVEMTLEEVIDFVIATGVIADAMDALETAILDQAGDAVINNIVQGIRDKFISWAVSFLVRIIA